MKRLSFTIIVPLCLASLLCIILVCCSKPDPPLIGPTPSNSVPKKIGIAFGGGGARTAVQIGVLKRLEELGIKADYVAGTSMGAIIAALYAAGYTSEQLDSLLKQDQDLWIYDRTKAFLFKGKDGRKMTGVIDRPYFQKHLNSLLENKDVYLYRDFEKDGKIPFRCIATNFSIEYYNEEVCSEGVVSKDLVSSSSYPGAFVFSKNKGKYLLDGGLTNNLPVDRVREMGAEVVIAIDLESDDENYTMELISMGLNLCGFFDAEASSYIDKYSATKWFKDREYIDKRKANIADADIYIHPAIGYKITDYDAVKIKDMIRIGYEACLIDSIAKKLEALK